MPMDATGTFRHNTESARMHSRAAGMNPDGEDQGEAAHELHDHGDGTFTTKHPEHGEMHHPTLGHALAHLAAKHGEAGHKHMHIHHDGETVHAHHVDGGEPEHEEHDPQNLDTLHDSMDQFLNEEKGERGGDGEEESSGAGDGLEGLY